MTHLPAGSSWDSTVYRLSPGEWLEYTVDVTGPMVIPATGGWNVFQTITKTGVTLPGGRKVLRLVVDQVSGSGSDAGAFDSLTVGP